MEGFSEALVYELEPFGIRVKIIEPGPIKTDFYDRSQDVMTKPGLTAYDGFIARVMPKLQKAGAEAPGPEIVARTIYRAATDGRHRLRYPANSAAVLLLRRLLPTGVFMCDSEEAVYQVTRTRGDSPVRRRTIAHGQETTTKRRVHRQVRHTRHVHLRPSPASTGWTTTRRSSGAWWRR